MKINLKSFLAERQLKQLQEELTKIDTTVDKINQIRQKIQFPLLADINSVCKMEVTTYHTSQIMVALGSDFFVKVTAEEALGIARRRRSNIRQRMEKLKKEKEKQPERVEEKEEVGSQMIKLQKNEEGEDVFEIIEYEDGQAEVKALEQDGTKIEKQLSKVVQTMEKLEKKDTRQEVKEQKELIRQPQQQPKKLSKFKQQKMKERGF